MILFCLFLIQKGGKLKKVLTFTITLIALIAIFYAAIAAVNKFKGTTYSATSFIVGAFFVAGTIIGNVFIGFMNLVVSVINTVWNVIATFVEFFANVFDNFGFWFLPIFLHFLGPFPFLQHNLFRYHF